MGISLSKNIRGFTIIEVLVAVVIGVTVAFSVISVISSNLKNQSSIRSQESFDALMTTIDNVIQHDQTCSLALSGGTLPAAPGTLGNIVLNINYSKNTSSTVTQLLGGVEGTGTDVGNDLYISNISIEKLNSTPRSVAHTVVAGSPPVLFDEYLTRLTITTSLKTDAVRGLFPPRSRVFIFPTYTTAGTNSIQGCQLSAGEELCLALGGKYDPTQTAGSECTPDPGVCYYGGSYGVDSGGIVAFDNPVVDPPAAACPPPVGSNNFTALKVATGSYTTAKACGKSLCSSTATYSVYECYQCH